MQLDRSMFKESINEMGHHFWNPAKVVFLLMHFCLCTGPWDINGNNTQSYRTFPSNHLWFVSAHMFKAVFSNTWVCPVVLRLHRDVGRTCGDNRCLQKVWPKCCMSWYYIFSSRRRASPPVKPLWHFDALWVFVPRLSRWLNGKQTHMRQFFLVSWFPQCKGYIYI